jgi:hypothetical protein
MSSKPSQPNLILSRGDLPPPENDVPKSNTSSSTLLSRELSSSTIDSTDPTSPTFADNTAPAGCLLPTWSTGRPGSPAAAPSGPPARPLAPRPGSAGAPVPALPASVRSVVRSSEPGLRVCGVARRGDRGKEFVCTALGLQQCSTGCATPVGQPSRNLEVQGLRR